ncbi:DUF4407 domain-containing protein [Rhodococcus sp. 15-649-2-2]|uniref:DUF4407 domain-containing protein n=1 Tax=Rhodococcus sp. 15-649-2-2 TaxID=2023140 RepID=UPI001595417A|nr:MULTISPECIES: DUF4407 domain-containing protein [unclassified Rhodococcus (in: high G+C Gram-positive bacteria)]
MTSYDDEEPTVYPDGSVGGGVERGGEELSGQYGPSRFSQALVWCAGPTYVRTAPVGTWTLLQSVGVAGLFSTMIVALSATIIAGLADMGPVWASIVSVVVAVLYFSYRRLVVATVASTVFARSRRTGSHLVSVAVMASVSVLTAGTGSWVFGMAIFGQEVRSQVAVNVAMHQQDDLNEWYRSREANRDVASRMYAEQLSQPAQMRDSLQDAVSGLEMREAGAWQMVMCEMTSSPDCFSGTGEVGIGPRSVAANEELDAVTTERTSAQQRLAEYTVFPVPAPFDAVQLATCGYSKQTTELTPYDSDRCQGMLLVESSVDQLAPEHPPARSSNGLLPHLEAFGSLLWNSENAGPVWLVVVGLFFVLVSVDLLPLLFLVQSGRRG